MKRETSEEKWNRLQSQIQEGILKAYPNPERKGCPNAQSLTALALRSSQFDDTVEDEPQWQHVTHCSPCYRQYLEELTSLGRTKVLDASSE